MRFLRNDDIGWFVQVIRTTGSERLGFYPTDEIVGMQEALLETILPTGEVPLRVENRPILAD